MSRHPVVNRRETTFVALAEKLGRELSCVRRHYRKLENQGPITMRDLLAPIRAAQAREGRDARIATARNMRGQSLLRISNKTGLTVQRIQQIAGSRNQ